MIRRSATTTALSFRVSDPVLMMFEGGYRYSLGGLPGTVKLGGWHQEGEFPHAARRHRRSATATTGSTPSSIR